MVRYIRQAILLATLFLLGAGTGRAQATPQSTDPPPSEKDLATVYVYRYDYGIVFPGFWFLNKTLPVYFGEGAYPRMRLRKIAGLRKKRFFMMRLPPGAYSFDTRRMSGKLKLEVAAGGEYYLRVDQGQDAPDDTDVLGQRTSEGRTAGLDIMPPEVAREQLRKVEPIKPKNVQDRKLVIIPPAAPANNGMPRARKSASLSSSKFRARR